MRGCVSSFIEGVSVGVRERGGCTFGAVLVKQVRQLVLERIPEEHEATMGCV